MDTASGEVTTWTVLYHKGPPGSEFKGRGEFLKLLFEDAGVPYHFSNAHLYGPDSWVDMYMYMSCSETPPSAEMAAL